MKLVALLAAVIAALALGFSMGRPAHAQTGPATPTPTMKVPPKTGTDSTPAKPYPVRRSYPMSYRQFTGAKECRQENGVLSCDNGFKQAVR